MEYAVQPWKWQNYQRLYTLDRTKDNKDLLNEIDLCTQRRNLVEALGIQRCLQKSDEDSPSNEPTKLTGFDNQ